MKTFEDVFSVLLHNYSSKKLKQLILLPSWGGMGEAAFSEAPLRAKKARKLELTNFRAMYKTFYRIVLLMNI